MSRYRIEVWNTKITTVEQLDEDSDVPCEGCEAQCCKGMLLPPLSKEEYLSGKYPIRIIQVPELEQKANGAENVIALAIYPETGCIFHKDNKCTIYNDRPKACRVYDCRKDDRPEIKEFVRKRQR